MFKKKPVNKTDEHLDAMIEGLLDTIDNDGFPTRPEEQLEFLKGLEDVRAKRSRPTFDPDKALVVLGNVVGIVIIVGYERQHVAISEAFKRLLRPES